MSMSEDEWKAERDFDRPRCACRGTGYVPIRGAGNYMAVEPCGCDEPAGDEDEDDLEAGNAYSARRASSSGPEPAPGEGWPAQSA